MQKNKVLIASGLLFITLIALVGFKTLHFYKTMKPEAEFQPTLPVESNISTTEITRGIKVYDIKGNSEKLTSQEKLSIVKWKKQIVDYATKFNNYVYLNGQTEEKDVALTFDDGPDSRITPKILDILKAYNVKASFFCIGQNVRTFPSIVKRAFNEGNLILNHSYDHPNFYNKDSKFISDEIERTNDIIRQVIGKTPALVRPPYGIVNDSVLNVAKANNVKLVIWSTDTFDWSQKDANHVAENVLENVRPGEIILMHCNEDKTQTVKALPVILEGLRHKGYRIVTLDSLLNTNAYNS